MLDGVELIGPSEHDDGTGFSIVAGPASEPGQYPSGIGERAFGVRVFLLFGFAFQTSADAFESWPIVRIEDIGERTFGFSLALGDQLHDLDGGDQDGGDKLFERTLGRLAQGFNVEAFCLHRSEQLLNRPARAIEADDAACIGDVMHLPSG